MKKLLSIVLSWQMVFGGLFVLVSPLPVLATTRNAISCSQSDIQTQVNASSPGDIVIVPHASCPSGSPISWTGTIDMTTHGQIEVECDVANACYVVNNNVTVCTGGGSPCPVGSQLFNITIGSTDHTILGGFNIAIGTACSGSPCQGADFTIQGTGLVPLMHDMTLAVKQFQLVQDVQWMVCGGVMWNMSFVGTLSSSGLTGGSFVVKPTIPVSPPAGTCPTWDSPDTMGTADTTGLNNLYVEDSTCTNVDQWPDMDDNARVTIRHTTMNGCAGLTHGTTSAVGGRSAELVNDIITSPGPNSLIPSNPCTTPSRNIARYFWWRAGTGVVTADQVSALGVCGFSGTSFQAAAEQAQRAVVTPYDHGCAVGYEGWHQPGSGSDGSTHMPSNVFLGVNPADGSTATQSDDPMQISDPIYVWDNTGGGNGSFTYNDGTPNGCNTSFVPGATTSSGTAHCSPQNGTSCLEFATTNLVHTGRDVFVDTSGSPTTGARPGYTICTTGPCGYPHPLRALVTGSVTLIPSSQAYGSVNLGFSSAPVIFTLTNNSSSSATGLTVAPSGGNSGDFIVSSNTCSSTLAASASCTLDVTFTPLGAGSRSTTLTASYSGGDGASPQLSTLTGTGTSVAPSTGSQLSGGLKIRSGVKIQ